MEMTPSSFKPPDRVAARERGPVRIGELLPRVLSHYGIDRMATADTAAPTITPEQDAAAVYAALAAVAKKELLREALPGGAAHKIELSLWARIDDRPEFKREFTAVLNVGFDSMRGASEACDPKHLLAYVLSKLNPATRQKLLNELPATFVKNDNQLPEVADALLEASGQLLAKLRTQKSSIVKGSVSVKYLPTADAPADYAPASS
jgi:hypothetical protein